MIYALDTNIIIHLLRQDKQVLAARNLAENSGVSFVIPPMVDYEIQRGFFYKPLPKKEKAYMEVKKRYGVGDTGLNVWTCAARLYASLRQKGFTVSDSDILIAAFCLENGYPLVTANIRDFENMSELRIINWQG